MFDAAAIMFEIESDVMDNMNKALISGSQNVYEWQSEKLAVLGTLREQNKKIIGKGIKEAVASAKIELADASIKATKGIDSAVPDKLSDVLPADASLQIKAILTTWESRTTMQLYKLGASMLVNAEAKFIDTIYKATAEKLLGILTLRQSIASVAVKWNAEGITGLVDKAGRDWSTEAYVQTVIRSNVRNVITDTQLQRMGEIGEDLVEVSSHVGARPGCAPYQGRVYSLSGKDEKYPALSSTTYGEASGLFGCNCRHYMSPYLRGMKKTFSPYTERENNKAYTDSQTQRRFERSIRQTKRELNFNKSYGTEESIKRSKEKLQNQRAKMREFVEENNLTRRYDREQIY